MCVCVCMLTKAAHIMYKANDCARQCLPLRMLMLHAHLRRFEDEVSSRPLTILSILVKVGLYALRLRPAAREASSRLSTARSGQDQ